MVEGNVAEARRVGKTKGGKEGDMASKRRGDGADSGDD